MNSIIVNLSECKGENMIEFKKILIVLIIIFCILGIFVFYNTVSKEDTHPVASNLNLSNKKMGWGIKRAENHKQPDLSTYLTILNKYNGIAMGNSEKPYVYLTFDAGYEAGYTDKILQVLKENNVKATFFITAHYLNSQPELVKRMIDEGHIVRESYCKSLQYARYR